MCWARWELASIAEPMISPTIFSAVVEDAGPQRSQRIIYGLHDVNPNSKPNSLRNISHRSIDGGCTIVDLGFLELMSATTCYLMGNEHRRLQLDTYRSYYRLLCLISHLTMSSKEDSESILVKAMMKNRTMSEEESQVRGQRAG